MMSARFFDLDVSKSTFKTDPHPFYARLRAEAPVARVRLRTGEDAYLAARHADVSALLKDVRFAKKPANALSSEALAKLRRPPAFLAPLQRNMLGLDDPDHARLKRLVQAAFTPRRVEILIGRTRAISTALLDAAAKRGHFDLIADYATPLPVMVISELLGVPERDQRRFARWSGALIRAAGTPLTGLLALPQIVAFMRYLRRLIAIKRADPADDLVTALVQAESAGDTLDGEELLAMIAILLSAGHETTQNLIGNGTLALLQDPEQATRLRDDPGLTETAIEELLRFAGPVETSTHRYAREDITIAGVLIPRGALVFGVIASANRDAQRFRDADRLDLGRDPNRHLTFGEGGHYCVGAALARMEGRVAFSDLLRRFPTLRLDRPAKTLRWNPGLVLRGMTTMPVSI